MASHLRHKAGIEVVVQHLQLEKLAVKRTEQPVSTAALENMSR
jgi:hypothetical protein